ncbi:odorant receptor 2a-like [Anthonomus grandis grandis]|uniref:odorant receptor 2a-like n=1 Tax=Anthonomus grandis grandis TaxID=2921223 RepID=UPI0021664115|nr:odorant receptor 2a-like [Anthonomus grandis grandis]
MLDLKSRSYFDWHYKISSYFLLIPPKNRFRRLYWLIAIPHIFLICLSIFLEGAKLCLGGSGNFSLDILNLGVMSLHCMGGNRVIRWHFIRDDIGKVLKRVTKINCDFCIFKISGGNSENKSKGQDNKETKHPIEIYRNKKIEETKIYCLILYVGVITYVGINLSSTFILNYLSSPEYEKWNPILNRTQLYRDYAYPLWYPFDTSLSDGYYWIGFFYQPYAYFFLVCGFFSIDTLCLNTIIHLTAHVQVIGFTLTFVDKNIDIKLKQSEAIKLKEKRILKCIQELQEIYTCAIDLNNIITMHMLVQQLCIVVITCCVVYRVTLVSAITELGILVSITAAVVGETFIVSWFYQNFTLELFELLDKVYNLDWVEYPPELRKVLLFLMQRLQKPFYFTMGHWQPLNNDICIATIKTSYSFYTLLTQL